MKYDGIVSWAQSSETGTSTQGMSDILLDEMKQRGREVPRHE